MARRPIASVVGGNAQRCSAPVEVPAHGARVLLTINVPPGGAVALPADPGVYVRLRPMPGATNADLDTVARSLRGCLGVLRMPVSPVGVGATGEPLMGNLEAPSTPRGETLADALAQACEHVLNQEGVRDQDERQAVVDAAFDMLRKAGV
jgi:hypothetical protein